MVEQPALGRSAAQGHGFGQCSLTGGGDAPQRRRLRGAGWFALAQQHGQGGGERLAGRMVVVAVRPLSQRQHVSGQNRRTVQHRQRRPQQSRVQFAPGSDLDEQTDGLPPAKWDSHPRTRLQGGKVTLRRRQIIEGSAQRGRNGDAQNRASHGE